VAKIHRAGVDGGSTGSFVLDVGRFEELTAEGLSIPEALALMIEESGRTPVSKRAAAKLRNRSSRRSAAMKKGADIVTAVAALVDLENAGNLASVSMADIARQGRIKISRLRHITTLADLRTLASLRKS
jgi:hypothetical protein